MTEAYDGRQVVGMDLHRRRSVLVRMTEDGRKLETARIDNSPAALRAVLTRAGKNPRVVVEATYGWYWAADVLQAAGAELHLAHPLGVKAFSYRRVKNDLLTELTMAVSRVSGRVGGRAITVGRHEHRRRRAAGSVSAGGAAGRVAGGDRGCVRAVPGDRCGRDRERRGGGVLAGAGCVGAAGLDTAVVCV
ncbi:MAG TPA: transposase [Streptosporangiaceae bacterium]